MTNEELESHLRAIGWRVETIRGIDPQDPRTYLVIRDYRISAGSLAGRVCDVAMERMTMVPYVPPAAVHTRPALVPMDMGAYRTQASAIGPEWQYWSRVVRRQPPTPRDIVTHIVTVLSEV